MHRPTFSSSSVGERNEEGDHAAHLSYDVHRILADGGLRSGRGTVLSRVVMRANPTFGNVVNIENVSDFGRGQKCRGAIPPPKLNIRV